MVQISRAAVNARIKLGKTPTHQYFTCRACGGCGFLPLKREYRITGKFGGSFNLGDLANLTELKTAKLKFSGGCNVSAVALLKQNTRPHTLAEELRLLNNW